MDPSDALRLVDAGWTLGQINSMQSHVKAAAILADGGLSREQVLALRAQLEGSAWRSGPLGRG